MSVPRRARRQLEHSNQQCVLGRALRELDASEDLDFQIVMHSPGDYVFLLCRDESGMAKAILHPESVEPEND